MFNSFDGSAELDKHWTGHADGYEGYTACDWALLCLPVVMDQLPEVYLGSASDQRRAEAWRCSNLTDVVYWIFFGTLWVTLWEILIKLLVQLRNFPFTTKRYFYTLQTFSTHSVTRPFTGLTFGLSRKVGCKSISRSSCFDITFSGPGSSLFHRQGRGGENC